CPSTPLFRSLGEDHALAMQHPAQIHELGGEHWRSLSVWDETQHREVVAADLLTLVGGEGLAERVFLVGHGCSEVLLEQLPETTLAEGAAARTADLIDQPVGGEVEAVAVLEWQRDVGVCRLRGIAPVAHALAVALDLYDALAIGAPQREASAGEGHLPLLHIDEANAGFEPVVGFALRLVLAEQALHPAMQSGQNLARFVAISAAQHTVEQAPGDQGHERAGH